MASAARRRHVVSNLRDIIVVLPGVTGSELSVRGRRLWSCSLHTIAWAVSDRAGWLRQLGQLDDEDVIADRLVPTVHIVPGCGG